MIQELLDIEPTDSFQDVCNRMSTFLGIKKQVPENAMRRAIEDPDYANNLITCRNAPDFLDVLLADPGNEQYAEQAAKKNKLSNTDLIQKAANAFLRWGKAGFSIVDDTVLKTREDACLACENMTKPETALQKMATSKAKEEIGKRVADCVCKLCGCSLSKKIRLPSESCPAQHPENMELNRWSELFVKTG